MAFSNNIFSDSRSHEGSFVVYIAGVEAPALAVEVDMGIWTIPSATLTVAPDIELVGLGREDRVPVAVFFLDEMYNDTVDPQFRLIFDGYITGWAYNNTPRGRMVSFSCVSDLSLFDELYPFFVTSMDTMVANSIMAAQPNAIPFYHAGMTFPASLLYNGFDPQQGAVKRPYDFIENALRSCLNVGRIPQIQSTVSSNFYSRFLRRFNMINKWAPSPLIESLSGDAGIFPVLKALQCQTVVSAVANKMKEFGNGGSFWNVFQKIFLMMYYEILAITTPSMAQVTLADKQRAEIVGPPKWLVDPGVAAAKKLDSTGSPFDDPTMPNRLLQYITKPQWLFGAPPMCNAIFPSMINSISFQEDYNAQPTRLGINDEMIVNMTNQSGNMAAIATLRGGYPLKYQQELDKKFGDGTSKGNVISSGKNFLIWPEEFYKGPRISQEVLPDWFGFLDDALKAEFSGQGKDTELAAKRKQLAFSYAQYEYERQRGATRRGGVDMIFNPYIVPGYTGMIFSDVASNQNYFVYLTSVKHTLTKGNMQTSVGFTFAQTLDELMHGVLDAKKDKTELADLVAAPLNPIVEVSNVSQLLPNVETYFSKIFHQNSPYAGNPAKLLKTAAFDYRKAVQLILANGSAVSLIDEKSLRDNNWLSKYVSVAPTANYAACFKNPDAAMQLVSRPICTLEEYITWHGNGIRKGKIDRYDGRQGKGGVFYEEILRFVPDPGTEAPVADENNNLVKEFPYDLRSNWSEKVRRYRHKIIFETTPQEA